MKISLAVPLFGVLLFAVACSPVEGPFQLYISRSEKVTVTDDLVVWERRGGEAAPRSIYVAPLEVHNVQDIDREGSPTASYHQKRFAAAIAKELMPRFRVEEQPHRGQVHINTRLVGDRSAEELYTLSRKFEISPREAESLHLVAEVRNSTTGELLAAIGAQDSSALLDQFSSSSEYSELAEKSDPFGDLALGLRYELQRLQK